MRNQTPKQEQKGTVKSSSSITNQTRVTVVSRPPPKITMVTSFHLNITYWCYQKNGLNRHHSSLQLKMRNYNIRKVSFYQSYTIFVPYITQLQVTQIPQILQFLTENESNTSFLIRRSAFSLLQGHILEQEFRHIWLLNCNLAPFHPNNSRCNTIVIFIVNWFPEVSVRKWFPLQMFVRKCSL